MGDKGEVNYLRHTAITKSSTLINAELCDRSNSSRAYFEVDKLNTTNNKCIVSLCKGKSLRINHCAFTRLTLAFEQFDVQLHWN